MHLEQNTAYQIVETVLSGGNQKYVNFTKIQKMVGMEKLSHF